MAEVRRSDARLLEFARLSGPIVSRWCKLTQQSEPQISVRLSSKDDSRGRTYLDEYRIVITLGTNPSGWKKILIHELAHLTPGSKGHTEMFYDNLFLLFKHFGLAKNSNAIMDEIWQRPKASLAAAERAGFKAVLG